MTVDFESFEKNDNAKILVVDDVPENLSILFDFLLGNHYQVLIAQDGEGALEVLKVEQVDLILLDVMMPGLNGFEVCQQLKANPSTCDIPVIFMTALSDTADKLKGFAVGAIDYVAKPIQQEEVLARIRTHLTIRQLQHKLSWQNQQLNESNSILLQKNQALAEKNAELDAFAQTVAHDLKNPLGNILGFCSLLQQNANDNNKTKNQDKEVQLKYINYIDQSAHKMQDIIESLLLLAGTSKKTDVLIECLEMESILKMVNFRLKPLIESTQAQFHSPNTWPVAYGYPAWIEEVWVNYVSNSLKYSSQPPVLALGADELDAEIKFWVKDNGAGLTTEQQARLFTPFTRLHRKQADGHGLGLCVVESIIRRLGGRAGVESQVGHGSLFYFTLPKHPPKMEDDNQATTF